MFARGFPECVYEKIGEAFRSSVTTKYLISYATESVIVKHFGVKKMMHVVVSMYGSQQRLTVSICERLAAESAQGVTLTKKLILPNSDEVYVDPMFLEAYFYSRESLSTTQRMLRLKQIAWEKGINMDSLKKVHAAVADEAGIFPTGSIGGITSVALNHIQSEGFRGTYEEMISTLQGTQHDNNATHQVLSPQEMQPVVAGTAVDMLRVIDKFHTQIIEYMLAVLNSVDWREAQMDSELLLRKIVELSK